MPDETACLPKTAELLAPAGEHAALVAAVRNGADAVYLGLHELNARRGAANFSLDELTESCRFAHLRGVKVYLTANVLIQPGEMDDAIALVDQAWTAGVDAVIVQDLGLLGLVRELLPHVRVHASTQLGAHNHETIAALAEVGVARVTLARELSIREIAGLAADEAQIETFVHGALCVCYSGQCLLSSMIGGRSANRGRCAQPCRLPYTLIDEGGLPVDGPGAYLLSPKDLAGAGHLPQLLASGVDALKIEGRVKSPEYVALVTGVYRGALDRAAADPEGFEVTDGEWSVLEEAFSRGFTSAYLDGTDDDLMGPTRPNNRGVLVGRLAGREGSRATLRLDRALDAGDRLEVWTRKGRFTQLAGRMEVDGRRVGTAPAGADVSIVLEGSAGSGDRVFRVANAALLEAARRTFAKTDEPRAVPVDLTVEVTVGERLRIVASGGGCEAEATGPVVEAARTKAIAAEEIMEHVGRLGGTPYRAVGWDIRLDPGAGLGYSALHRTRREALDRLDAARLVDFADRRPTSPSVPREKRQRERSEVTLVAVAGSEAAALACLAEGVDHVLLAVDPSDEPRELPDGVAPLLPRVARGAEPATQVRWLDVCGRGTVGNLGVLYEAGRRGHEVSADWCLNTTNAYAAAALADEGARSVWLSPELTVAQIGAVAGGSPVPVGVSVMGRQELMVVEHCVLKAAGPCDGRCGECSRRERMWLLEDRKEYRFPVTSDGSGRTHLFNSVPLDVTHALREIVASGVAMLRLDLPSDSPDDAARLTRSVRTRLDDALAGRPAPTERLLTPATTGHFFRGVE